jgi:hypothetical protein
MERGPGYVRKYSKGCRNNVKTGILGREGSIQNWFVIFIYSREIELRRA